MAYRPFHNLHLRLGRLVVQVAVLAEAGFWVEVTHVQEEVPWFLCASSMSADSLQWHWAIELSSLYDYINHCPVSFYRSINLDIPRKHKLLASPCLETLAGGVVILCCVFRIAAQEHPA